MSEKYRARQLTGQVNGSLRSSMHANLVSLFASSSTLICCALPALFVSLGAGATLSSLVTNIPQLIWVSEHKLLVFGFAGLMLAIAGAMQWLTRNAPCPADANLAALCAKTRKTSLQIYFVSVGIFCVGATFAFVAPLII